MKPFEHICMKHTVLFKLSNRARSASERYILKPSVHILFKQDNIASKKYILVSLSDNLRVG